MPDVKERTTSYLTVVFKDKNGAAAVPTAVSYRVYRLTPGAAIRASTARTPASSSEITLTPADNAIQVVANNRETRRVTVHAEYGGAGDEVNDEYTYDVVNLSHHP